MTPISLMPPVDYCPSCEGQKAERAAEQIGDARAEQAEFQNAADPASSAAPGAPTPGGGPAGVSGESTPRPATGTVPSLLAPDLAVQASLAGSGIEKGDGAADALRLRAAQAYQAP